MRQPLPRILTVTGANVESNVIDQVAAIIREETNIKSIEYVEGSSDVVKRQAKANFKALGRRLGKLMKPVSQAIRNLTPEDIDLFLSQGKIEIDAGSEMVTLTGDDLEIVSEGIEGWLVGQEGGVTVALDTQISPELQAEGYARETVNRIQNMRKEANYEVTDRIAVQFNGSDSILSAINFHAESIRNETLCLELQRASRPGGDLVADFEINSENLTISIQKKND